MPNSAERYEFCGYFHTHTHQPGLAGNIENLSFYRFALFGVLSEFENGDKKAVAFIDVDNCTAWCTSAHNYRHSLTFSTEKFNLHGILWGKYSHNIIMQRLFLA